MAGVGPSGVPRWALLPLVLAALVASGVWIERAPDRAGVPGTAPHRPSTTLEPEPELTASPDARPEIVGAPSSLDYGCRVPEAPIERKSACDDGLSYPACKWRLPAPHLAGRTYAIWRNTDPEHLWGRPALVATILGAAREYARHYPGERLAVGDLDAIGPRHETHDSGVDVDLYLPSEMEVENLGGGEYAENYAGLDRLAVRARRGRVETLARVLATCTQGRLRIYYNDDDVRARFLDWFDARGFSSPFGRPMQKHNDLHRFHFHVTIPKDLPLPAPEGSTT